MCDPVSAAMVIGGAALNYKADRDAAKKQEAEQGMFYDMNLKQQAEGQDQIDARVKEQLPQYELEATQQRIAEQARSTEGSINDAILSANLTNDAPETKGKVSGAYQRAAAQHTADNARDVAELAKRYAGLQAPNLVNLRDTIAREDTGWDIQAAMDTINRQGQIHNTAASLVNVTANPWLKGIGQGMMMFGNATAANPGAATVTESAPAAYGTTAAAAPASMAAKPFMGAAPMMATTVPRRSF